MSTDDADAKKDAEATEKIELDKAPAAAEAKTDEAAKTGGESAKSGDDSKKKTGQPAAAPAPSANEGRSNLLPVIAAFVAGILLVAAVTAVVAFYMQAQQKKDELAAVREATAAGCAFGRTVSEYDYANNLQAYFDKVKNDSTGEFLQEFGDATTALADAMNQAQVKSWVDDVQCGYQSGDTSEAKVLVTLTQFRTNFSQPQPDRQFVVIIADMRHEDGRWKVAKLDSPMLRGMGTGLPGAPAETPAPGEQPAPTEQPQQQPGN
ncbi:hypothetical protein IU433_12745 [Nocardia puris]|uniref:hypothetical protein n=1 Tax=Nocardia puris TaxID=208602 RepID=UPI0018940B15|nr:hypothetical protein [Nocardia puris]MBF6213631.1 hypothetical protein [Nocardia puris]MBF6365439.1 hypothetical protein [Nocardia puris]MBF6459905.1 hypothetical protein [Nocardia puris]